MNTPELNTLFQQLDEITRQAYEVPAKSWEEYQRRVGIYQGIRQAIDILIDLQNQGESE
jgi:hypothetical protein